MKAASATAAWAGVVPRPRRGSRAATRESKASPAPTAFPVPGPGQGQAGHRRRRPLGRHGRLGGYRRPRDGRHLQGVRAAAARAHALSRTGEKAADPRVAVAADGTAVVAWRTPEANRGVAAPRPPAPSARRGNTGQAWRRGVGDRTSAARRSARRATRPRSWFVSTHDKGDHLPRASSPRAGGQGFAKASEVTGHVSAGSRTASNPAGRARRAAANALAVWGAMIDGAARRSRRRRTTPARPPRPWPGRYAFVKAPACA